MKQASLVKHIVPVLPLTDIWEVLLCTGYLHVRIMWVENSQTSFVPPFFLKKPQNKQTASLSGATYICSGHLDCVEAIRHHPVKQHSLLLSWLSVMGSFRLPWKLPLLIIWFTAAAPSLTFHLFSPPLVIFKSREPQRRTSRSVEEVAKTEGRDRCYICPQGKMSPCWFLWGWNQSRRQRV